MKFGSSVVLIPLVIEYVNNDWMLMKIRRVIYKNAGKMCHFQIFICLYLAYNYNSDSRGSLRV